MRGVAAALYMAIGVALVVLVLVVSDRQAKFTQLADTTMSTCRRLNSDRVQFNTRGDVLRRFLRTAALARESATVDVAANRAAAAQWRLMADGVIDIPYLDCDGDGVADIPRR